MPLVNGKKVAFDPVRIAREIISGSEISPDVNDYESDSAREERIKTEWGMVEKALEDNFPDEWQRLRNKQAPGLYEVLRPIQEAKNSKKRSFLTSDIA